MKHLKSKCTFNDIVMHAKFFQCISTLKLYRFRLEEKRINTIQPELHNLAINMNLSSCIFNTFGCQKCLKC